MSNDNYESEIKSIQITSQIENGYQKLSFTGRLVYGNTQTVKTIINNKLEESPSYIFDMSGLDYIDSTGLGLLLNVSKPLYNKNKKIVVILTDDFISELFSIAKFDYIFVIANSMEEALGLLKTDCKPKLYFNQY